MEYSEKKRSLFFGLPLSFTKYHLTEDVITVKQGLLRQVENDCYMYKITDVRLETGILERMLGLGTIHCFGGDLTDPELVIQHVKNARAIKDFILKNAEEQRLKRKTLNMQHIDCGPEINHLAQEDSCKF